MLQRVIFAYSKYLAVPYNYSADNSAICSAGTHVEIKRGPDIHAQSIFARSAKTGFTRIAAGSTLVCGVRQRGRERESRDRDVVLFRAATFSIYRGNVDETAQGVQRLPTSHVARLPLPFAPSRVSFVFGSRARMYRHFAFCISKYRKL